MQSNTSNKYSDNSGRGERERSGGDKGGVGERQREDKRESVGKSDRRRNMNKQVRVSRQTCLTAHTFLQTDS